jgi:hypothetical protein
MADEDEMAAFMAAYEGVDAEKYEEKDADEILEQQVELNQSTSNLDIEPEDKRTEFSSTATGIDPASKIEQKIFFALQKNQSYFDYLKQNRNILYLNVDMLAEAYKIATNQKNLDLNEYKSVDIQADLYRYQKLIDECIKNAH